MEKMSKINTFLRRFLKTTARPRALKVKKLQEQADQQPCLSLVDRCIVRPACGCPKVVIIGGGLAGLSAADRLASCGLDYITVLEANSRLGGRLMSCWLGDTTVEMGSEGVPDGLSITNPLFSLALAFGEGDIDKVFKPKHKNPTVFLASGSSAIKDFEAEELLFDHILKETPYLDKNTSLLHFLSLRINQELLSYPEEERYQAERILYGMVNELRGYWGGDLSNVSAPLLGLRKTIVGKDVIVPQGMPSLLTPLFQVIPFHRVFQMKEVTKVEWKQEIIPGQPRATVYTADWDCFEADYVIITLPIGVLKEKAAELFQPPLPQNKLEAINSVGCGVMNKIFAEYGEPWWGGSGYRIRLAWTPQEILQETDWTRGINLISAPSRTVMEVRMNGAEAMMLEQCTEEEIALELTRFFRKLVCDSTIPFPNHVVATRWGSSQYCKGSFMRLTVNTTEDHLEELKAPVPEEPVPVLLFAGDATDPSNFGTTIGARLSGIREADRILQLTRQFNGPPK